MSPSGMSEIPRLQAKRKSVMPAQAGIQRGGGGANTQTWIPAFAGMTEGQVDLKSLLSESIGFKPRVVQLYPKEMFISVRALRATALGIPA